MRSVLLSIILCFILSCGEHDFPRYGDDKDSEINAGNKYQYFAVNLIPLNSRFSPFVSSQTLFWFKERQFYAKLVFWGRIPQLRVRPVIHQGDSCPNELDDVNRDGIIDASEVRLISGAVLLPLDRNLQSRSRGSDWFPVTDPDGDFVYSRAARLQDMLTDIGITSLDEFALATRTLILYGTSGNPFLPIACGKIVVD